MSIKTKILLPMIVIILLVAAATLVSTIILFSRFVESSTRDRVDAASRVAIRNLDFLKADAHVAALVISQNQGIVNALASGNRAALLTRAEKLQKETGAEFCTIVDTKGIVVLRTHDPESSGDSLIAQANIRSAITGKSLATVERGTVVRLAVRSGAPIRDGKGILVGAVSVGYRLDTPSFVDSIQRMLLCEAGILLGDQRVSTTVLREDGERAVGTRADPLVSQAVLAGKPYEGRADILGRVALTRYTPILGSDNRVIGMLFVGRYMDEAERTIRAFVRSGALMALGLLIVAILIVNVIVNRITKPILAMTNAASALASGDTDIDVQQIRAGGEIRTLVDAFRGMIANARQQVRTMETIAGGGLAEPLRERSPNDVLNRALEKLNQTIWKKNATLDAAREAAERANRAKTDFLSNVSHELRTPLNAVLGLSQLTLGRDDLPEEVESNLGKIHNSGSTLLGIVNDILDLSKMESGKFTITPREYDVPSMINDVVSQNVLHIGSKPIHFLMHIDEKIPARLLGDELRIKQIINNVLSNAFKYTEKGTVNFEMYCERESSSLIRLMIWIADTGCGIRPEDMDKLFVDYIRLDLPTHHKVSGTGLGLCIAKKLSEMMDGSISVESEYGKGSVFTISLQQQCVGDSVIGAEVVENLKNFRYSQDRRCVKGKLERIQLPDARVLVVDDNITNLDIAKGLLKPYSMSVDCVTGGQEAIEAIRAETPRYDAVLMDHMMPEMNGMEATRHIREIGTEYAKNIPVIALTADAVVGNEAIFLANGFQAFVSKPVDIERLDEAIRRFVRKKKSDAAGVDADNPQSSRKLQPIDGLDMAKARTRFRDEETLAEVLQSYATHTGSLLASIETVDGENLEKYATVVHGIKGVAWSIYAADVGDRAAALEAAAKAGDLDFIFQNNSAFLKAAEKLNENIAKQLS